MKLRKYELLIPFFTFLCCFGTALFFMPDAKAEGGGRLPFLLMVAALFSLLAATLIFLLIRVIFAAPIRALRRTVENYGVDAPEKKSGRKDEVGALHNSIIDLKKQLAAEREKQNRIIASISHDIKTPLTSVMGYTERLQNSPNLTPERREKYLATIYQKSKEIRDIVLEFDDYISCNLRTEESMAVIPTETMLRTISEEIKSEIAGEHAEIVLIDETTPRDCVFADIKKMHRVFSNIVSNSIRHADAERLSIRVLVQKKGDLIEFAISDNGQGVRENELSRVFEPMYTTDKSRSIAGLGLAICREIITAHGGTIRAESAPGRGFTVIFTLKCVTI